MSEGPQTLDEATKIIKDLVLWINTKSRYLPDNDKAAILEYMNRKGIRGSVFRSSTHNPEKEE